jgi:hypothetical protein
LATRLFGAAPSTAAFLFLAPAMWLTEDQQPKFLCQLILMRVSPHTNPAVQDNLTRLFASR